MKSSIAARQAKAGIAFSAPAMVLLLIFLVTPVLLAFGLGFTNAKLSSPKPAEIVGISNFEKLLKFSKVEVSTTSTEPEAIYAEVRKLTKPGSGTPYEGMSILRGSIASDGMSGSFFLAGDPLFWKSLRNTVFFAVIVAPLQGGLALLLALLVNSRIRGRIFFRTVFFLPVVTSMVVVSILWLFMYQEYGLANNFLNFFLPNYQPKNFLADTSTALPAIIFMSVWQGVGFHMLIWLSGLQTIPAEQYEAARVDGANGLQVFRHVTWPGLRNTFVFILVTITIAAFGLFTQIAVMTQGGPLDSTTTIIYHAFWTGTRKQMIGYSSAIALIFFIIVVTISLLQKRLTRERD